MAKWGKFDFREFEQLRDNVERLQKDWNRFMEEFLLEMALRALRKIKKRTPVDTGELRRKWTVGQVIRQGDTYIVEIINPVEYASFVEFGHRSGPGLTEWTEGRFMMTISMQEIERELPRYLEKRLVEWMRRHGL